MINNKNKNELLCQFVEKSFETRDKTIEFGAF